MSELTAGETECENCGMVDVPLVKDDCCAGCVCQRCGKSAVDVGRSMNDMGWVRRLRSPAAPPGRRIRGRSRQRDHRTTRRVS
jgi:hypothetical protein